VNKVITHEDYLNIIAVTYKRIHHIFILQLKRGGLMRSFSLLVLKKQVINIWSH